MNCVLIGEIQREKMAEFQYELKEEIGVLSVSTMEHPVIRIVSDGTMLG